MQNYRYFRVTRHLACHLCDICSRPEVSVDQI